MIVVRGTYNAPFKTFDYGTVLARKRPWTAAEIAQIEALARQRGTGILYAPDGTAQDGWRGLQGASSVQSFCSGYHINVCPPTDDKPFFFYMKRLSDLGGAATSFSIGVPDPMVMLLLVLGILLVLCAVAFVLPLLLVRPEGRPPAASLSFFGFLGVGFLVLEVVLIQRFVLFLGFPTYALSVVLCALLVSTGVGALLTTRAGFGTRRTLIAATGCRGGAGRDRRVRAGAAAGGAARPAVRGARGGRARGDRAARPAARDGDADRAEAAVGAVPGGGAVGLGDQRLHVGRGVGAGDRGGDPVRLRDDDAAGRALLPRRLPARRRAALAGSDEADAPAEPDRELVMA